jgi:hypothetical protein
VPWKRDTDDDETYKSKEGEDPVRIAGRETHFRPLGSADCPRKRWRKALLIAEGKGRPTRPVEIYSALKSIMVILLECCFP